MRKPSSSLDSRSRQKSVHHRDNSGSFRTELLRIEALVAGGAGLGRRHGGACVFIPNTAPGDLVEAGVSSDPKVLGGTLRAVVEPGPDRVAVPCPLAGRCGGCDWMHLSDAAQCAGHATIVRDAIAHAIRSEDLPEIRVHRAPRLLQYRTRARLFLEAQRGELRVGYREAGTHDLSPVDRCLVLSPGLVSIAVELSCVFARASGRGDATVALGQHNRPVVSLDWDGDLAADVWTAIDAAVKKGTWAGVRVVLKGASVPAVFGDPRPVVTGADGAPLVIAAGGFAQASDEGAAVLARRVAELSRFEAMGKAAGSQRIVELFSGSGTLSVLLAKNSDSLVCAELDSAACAAARENLGTRGLVAKVVNTDADAFAIPRDTAIVVLDPPRSGAPGSVRAIAARKPKVVVYVSCEPTTLARDLKVLVSSGLVITDLETVELFPQTSHVETIVRLARMP